MARRLARWREGRNLALLGLCALVAYAARSVVVADTLSDAADLAITAGALALIVAALVIALRRRPAGAAATWPRTFAVPGALVLIGALFVARSYTDVCVEAESLVMSATPDGPAAVIALGPRGDDVRLAGEIHTGDAARLAALLAQNPKVVRIALTSDGGLADEGEALGEVIAAHGLATYVPDYCVSACTLAFVAARERIAMRGARLGFHAPFEEGLFGQTFRGDPSGARTAYLEAGLDAGFVDEALRVGADDIWYPEPDRLVAAHVVTRFVDRDRLPDSNLDADPTPAGARETVLRNFPILAGLDDATPALVARIADWYLEAYRHDWSEGRVVAGLRMLSDSAVALVIAAADDAALVDLARYVDKAMRAADAHDCQAIGARGDLVTAAAVLGRGDGAAVKTAAGLVEAAMRRPRHTAEAIIPPGRTTLIAYRDAAPPSCANLRRAYAAALARPVPEAATLLRPRFTDWARRSIGPLAAAISEVGR